jgi:hypothetical protein
MFDKFKSVAIEGYIKNKFPQYLENGEISVDLKTAEAKCSIKVRLAGEEKAFSIDVNHYDVIEKDGEKYLCITDLKSERKWVDCALNDFLKNKEFKLPSFAASAL